METKSASHYLAMFCWEAVQRAEMAMRELGVKGTASFVLLFLHRVSEIPR